MLLTSTCVVEPGYRCMHQKFAHNPFIATTYLSMYACAYTAVVYTYLVQWGYLPDTQLNAPVECK